MITNPNNMVLLRGHVRDDPVLDASNRTGAFFLDIPRDPPGPEGILFDVARITVTGEGAYERASVLRRGAMVRVIGHVSYAPNSRVALSIAADHIEYLGISIFVKGERRLMEVLGYGLDNEGPELQSGVKAGFIEKTLGVFWIKG